MRSTGEPPSAARVVLIVVVVAAAAVWWWTHRAGELPATSTVGKPPRTSAAIASPAATAAAVVPARLTVAVSDDRGPLAGATVRLSPRDGETIVATTGADGVARVDHLEPGTWRVSASAADHLPAALPARPLAAGATDALAIKLATGGRTLRGTVSDATSGPVVGARIDAARLTAGLQPGAAVSTAITGSDGTYRLTVAEGALTVAVASPDYAPQARTIEVGPAGAVADFSLVPGGVIEGVVRDERTRQPIAGARVGARRDSPATVLAEAGGHRVIAGLDGRFRIAGLRPGAWELAATAQARHSKATTIIGLGVAEQITDVELLIGAGPVIRGRVVDDAGAPAANLTVRASTRGTGGEATGDAAGAFTLEGLAPGEYAIIADGDGYLPAGPARVAFGDEDVAGVVVTVKRGVLIAGHVEPRQPCEIQVDSEPQGGTMMLVAGTATGAGGEFTIGPTVGGRLTLTARCTSGDQGEVQIAPAPGMAETVLRVTPGASIAGRISDATGAPVAGAGVVASEVSSGERMVITNGMVTSGVHGMTDATGAYKLAGLAPGTYRVAALDRGRPLRTRGAPPRVELAANAHRTGVDLVVDRADGVISGTVTGPDGAPLADAWVSAQQDLTSMLDPDRGAAPGPGSSESRTMMVRSQGSPDDAGDSSAPPALTDAQGHYAIRGLSHGTFAVVAEAQRGQLRARAAGVRPDATVDLRATGVTSLAGKVTGPAGPIALFTVELDGPTRTQRSFTDGAYAFARVDPGTYTVRVQARDGNAQQTITIAPDQPATLDIALAANAVVIGKLVDPDGAPVAGQVLVVIPDAADGRLQAMIDGTPPITGPDGSFRIEHRAERAAVLVMRSPQPFSKRGLALEAGKTLDVGTIVLPPPGPGAGPPAKP